MKRITILILGLLVAFLNIYSQVNIETVLADIENNNTGIYFVNCGPVCIYCLVFCFVSRIVLVWMLRMPRLFVFSLFELFSFSKCLICSREKFQGDHHLGLVQQGFFYLCVML